MMHDNYIFFFVLVGCGFFNQPFAESKTNSFIFLTDTEADYG